MPAADILRRAFELGIRAIDTSAYYGPSEIIIGEALGKLSSEYPRENYYLISKAGRVTETEFDYSASSIRASVLRSLERLRTDHLDILYIHDVEFVPESETFTAVSTAPQLKREGLVKHVGISGYPVDYCRLPAPDSVSTIKAAPIVNSRPEISLTASNGYLEVPSLPEDLLR